MSNEFNNIDNLFKDKLGEYSVDAPEHVWQAIQARRTPLYKALNFFKGKSGAVALTLLLLTTVGGIAYWQTNTNITTTPKNNTFVQANTNSIDTAPVTAAKTSAATTSTPQSNLSYTKIPTSTTNQSSSTKYTSAAAQSTATKTNGNGATTPKTSTPTNGADIPTGTETENNSTTPLNTKADEQNSKENKENPIAQNDEETPKNATIDNPETLLTNNEADATEKEKEVKKQLMPAVQPTKSLSKFTADVYGGVSFVGRTLTANGANNNYIDAKRQAESFSPSLNLGVRINYDFSKFITLRAGVQYTKLGERINFERKYNYTTIDTTTGVILDPVTQQPIGTITRIDTNQRTATAKANTKNTISFIDIPVQLEWNLIKTPKYSVFATTGAALNLRFTQQGHQINKKLTGVDALSTNNNPYKTTAGLSVLAGLGINYNLSPRYSIVAEGTYRQGISNVMKNEAGMQQTFKMFSTSVGIRYRF